MESNDLVQPKMHFCFQDKAAKISAPTEQYILHQRNLLLFGEITQHEFALDSFLGLAKLIPLQYTDFKPLFELVSQLTFESCVKELVLIMLILEKTKQDSTFRPEFVKCILVHFDHDIVLRILTSFVKLSFDFAIFIFNSVEDLPKRISQQIINHEKTFFEYMNLLNAYACQSGFFSKFQKTYYQLAMNIHYFQPMIQEVGFTILYNVCYFQDKMVSIIQNMPRLDLLFSNCCVSLKTLKNASKFVALLSEKFDDSFILFQVCNIQLLFNFAVKLSDSASLCYIAYCFYDCVLDGHIQFFIEYKIYSILFDLKPKVSYLTWRQFVDFFAVSLAEANFDQFLMIFDQEMFIALVEVYQTEEKNSKIRMNILDAFSKFSSFTLFEIEENFQWLNEELLQEIIMSNDFLSGDEIKDLFSTLFFR